MVRCVGDPDVATSRDRTAAPWKTRDSNEFGTRALSAFVSIADERRSRSSSTIQDSRILETKRRRRDAQSVRAEKVSHWLTSPDDMPRRNQRWRCALVPCVNASGTT